MNKDINTGSMLRVGTLLHGTYRVDGYLSSGGFGNTYVVTNIQFDERYAVKEFFMKGVSMRDDNNTTVSVSIADNKTTFESQLEKFKKEARRLRKLKNDHIVRVYDLFEENGTAYYVMDFIQGENLAERLKRTRQPLSEAETLNILRQVLDALRTAHSLGIWHLDLKPANIMVEADGNAKLIDFGASKQQSAKGGATTSTAVSYTNGYAPREQMEQNLDKFGPWTDLYALGATVYTLLTNQKPPLPSDIDDDRTTDKHLSLPMPQEVSESTRRLVLWLMSTSRLDRPQSVDDVLDFLNGGIRDILDPPVDEPVSAHTAVHTTDETIIGSKKVQPAPSQETKLGRPKPKPAQPQEPPTPEEPLVKPAEPSEPIVEPSEPSNPQAVYGNQDGDSSNGKHIVLGLLVVAAIVVVIWLLTHIGGSSSGPATDVDSVAEATVDSITNVTDMPIDTVGLLGPCKYTGPIMHNLPEGNGEAWFTNGSYYKGHFTQGVMDGDDGFFRFKNGDTFTGSFRDNHFSKGTYTSKQDGSYFEGTFNADGQPKKGVWYDANGKKLQSV